MVVTLRTSQPSLSISTVEPCRQVRTGAPANYVRDFALGESRYLSQCIAPVDEFSSEFLQLGRRIGSVLHAV